MSENLEKLIQKAKDVKSTESDTQERRESFAYGNTKFENSLVTKEMVSEQAKKLKAQDGG